MKRDKKKIFLMDWINIITNLSDSSFLRLGEITRCFGEEEEGRKLHLMKLKWMWTRAALSAHIDGNMKSINYATNSEPIAFNS